MNKIYQIVCVGIFFVILLSSFKKQDQFNGTYFPFSVAIDSIKKDSIKNDSIAIDSIKIESNILYKLYKKNAHASYYADKFNGRKTANGEIFDNKKNTAAHKTLPFGTLIRVTNEANGKSILVTINDRGPFTKGREIDLSKKAFREIARHHGYGSMKVTIEVVEEIITDDE
ncbi:septal ring lytic transglycosylase RlpA family protein [Flavobacterium orientale]|uniref:Probable endolytic peptidoglycan transglycosylase RlpA n=1 Tax=Flavobacterium orientale TaxID=1756020 RepID=A0A916XYP7_9FLAO|nr:septal ring lytic transglycosylase RlpA family protein [Flavobacterium orientale]GGD21456.1 hypothetical protein GCM10011343_09880 [Flavobacterium orientale]